METIKHILTLFIQYTILRYEVVIEMGSKPNNNFNYTNVIHLKLIVSNTITISRRRINSNFSFLATNITQSHHIFKAITPIIHCSDLTLAVKENWCMKMGLRMNDFLKLMPSLLENLYLTPTVSIFRLKLKYWMCILRWMVQRKYL